MIVSSARAKSIGVSASISITSKAISMREKGIDVISLSVGEPDSDMPDIVKKEAIEALDAGKTKYTKVDGITELKVAIKNKLKKDNFLDYQSDEIIVGCGAKQIIFNAVMAFVDIGDEVIIPSPYWVSYPEMVNFSQGKCVFLRGKEENNFKILPEDLKKVINPRTKAIFLNSPSNPTGVVYSKDELISLGDVLKDKNILIISDEIYEKIVYPPHKHYSIAHLCPYLKEQTLVVNGLSKAYAMTGMRVGYGAGSKSIINQIKKIQSHSTSNTNSIAQYASVSALERCDEFVSNLTCVLNGKRDFLYDKLKNVKGFNIQKPNGAFYFFPNISYYLNSMFKSDIEFSDFLLEKARVAVVPGAAFGSDEHIRISYATSIDLLNQAAERIKNAVENL